MPDAARPRRPRRAVGPAGAVPAEEPRLDLGREPAGAVTPQDAERYRREQPPHHDQGV